MIRVLLVEDHVSFRQALGIALSFEPGIEMVGEASTLFEAHTKLDGVDVAVIDLELPDGVGTDLIEPFHSINPNGQVLVLTASSSQTDILRAVELGASGLLHKSAGVSDILSAIHRLGAGELLWSPAELLELMKLARRERAEREAALQLLRKLTAREHEVLRALASGSSDRDIAAELSIGVETVKTHMASILAKLQVESRLQALVFAVRHNVVRLE